MHFPFFLLFLTAEKATFLGSVSFSHSAGCGWSSPSAQQQPMLSQQQARASLPSSGRIPCCAFEWLLFGLHLNTHIIFKASRVDLRGEMKPAEPDPIESSENPSSSFYPIPFPWRGAAPAARALLPAIGCTQHPLLLFTWCFPKDFGDFFPVPTQGEPPPSAP